ncbi:TPA: DNA polymerase III subunit theta [Proteus mirabilis]|uniref:DNA polymerase III subunit theta n=1 Tax=Proteus mirabilis TaxID=584 RepID=UPI0013D80F38|nr:DNA polymerase III subunit theta [Proteus mirabilis]MBG3068815.1 DNA polymerase III subunit theta [Proteus mirabilis]MBI6427052.1 DNA polymerase III subunit theta [Proteus mirabilis]MBI6430274.1 DNA polymerase III subunit theta [Proteus mirabilis]HDS8345505.1 DNA polymerase III subunit theta [Proteus mirabilis]HDT1951479.1 DNA polymerase III subunit theta [Proteus mirabilis]
MCYESRKLNSRRKDKINVDLAASGVAYKERLNMPVVASEVGRQQPAHLREYFNERLAFYRERSKTLPDSKLVQYLKIEQIIRLYLLITSYCKLHHRSFL